MESRRHNFDLIAAQGRQLCDQCDGQTSSKITEITLRIQQQWTIIEQRLQEIIQPSREVVDNWRQFNSSYVHLLDRLSELEGRWYTIQGEKLTFDIDSLFDKAKVSQNIESLLSNHNFSSGFSTTSSTTRYRSE
jgi:Zn-dependent M32 family carboxypeptidase